MGEINERCGWVLAHIYLCSLECLYFSIVFLIKLLILILVAEGKEGEAGRG